MVAQERGTKLAPRLGRSLKLMSFPTHHYMEKPIRFGS